MITISDGILTIPEGERFVGFAGDNLHSQKNFYIRNCTQSEWLYRLYLTFDDGRHNFFVLPSTVDGDGTLLTWNIEESHIFKSGLVKAQIKAFSDTEEVYHTTSDVFVAGKTAEEDEEFKNGNSEFLSFEKKLNELYGKIETASGKMPYVGENGNWYIYSSVDGIFKDSGVSASAGINNGGVTPEKLDRKYWQKLERIPVYSYDYFDAMLEEDTSSDAVYRVEFSGLSPIKATVGEGSFIAVASVGAKYLFVLNLTNGDMWIYEKGGSSLKPVTAKLADESVTAEKIADGAVSDSKLQQSYIPTVEVIKVMTANPTITLSSNTEYRVTEYAQKLTVLLPLDISDDFQCSLVFNSSSAATALTAPSSIKWSGDDVAAISKTQNGTEITYNCLVPQPNKLYNVLFWYDGFNVNGVSRGVTVG